MISLIVTFAHWLWSLLESAVERSEGWFFTRRWEVAPGGIPACLVAGTLLFIVFGQRSKPSVAVAEPYRQAFRDALIVKDFERAELFLKKLIELQVADDSSRFQFALMAEAAGQSDAALEQIWMLAPEDIVVYPPAHLWVAQRELRRQKSWTSDDRRRYMHHLEAAKADAGIQPQAAELLGVLHFADQDFNAAAEELKSIPEPTLNARIALAMTCQLAGRHDDSRIAWSHVATACERQLKDSPDRVDIRLLLAVAYSHQQQHGRTVQVLREGLRRPSTASDRRLQEALALALVQRLHSSTKLPKDATDRESLLQELLDLAPNSPTVALRLIRWSEGDAREAQQIYDELSRRAEADATTATALNSVLGTVAAESGQFTDARTHLERACQQNPNNPALLNNLAWVLANSQPPELGRALELANSAIKMLPENAEFRETRGQILLRQRQWQAAVADLEWALPRIKSQSLPTVHAALAEAYAHLGNKERAEHHRAQSAALEAVSKP